MDYPKHQVNDGRLVFMDYSKHELLNSNAAIIRKKNTSGIRQCQKKLNMSTYRLLL